MRAKQTGTDGRSKEVPKTTPCPKLAPFTGRTFQIKRSKSNWPSATNPRGGTFSKSKFPAPGKKRGRQVRVFSGSGLLMAGAHRTAAVIL